MLAAFFDRTRLVAVAVLSLVLGCSAGRMARSRAPLAASERADLRSSPSSPTGPFSTAAPQLRVTKADWCRHGGAQLIGEPVVGTAGETYAVSVDGYLHAYESDGRYRFSYTVSGTPLGGPTLRPSDGAILLGTTGRLIYAIHSAGTLAFKASTVTPVWSGLHALDARSLAYLGLDGYLYALSNSGAGLFRVHVPGRPVGEPVVGLDGALWIPLDSGVARFERALRVTRTPLPAAVDAMTLSGSSAVVLAGGQVVRVESGGSLETLGRGAFLAGDGTEVVWLDEKGHGMSWAPHVGPTPLTLAGELRLDESVSAAPALRGDWLAVPLSSGDLIVVRLRPPGMLPRRWQLTREPLGPPVWVTPGTRLVAPTRSGGVCSFALRPQQQ